MAPQTRKMMSWLRRLLDLRIERTRQLDALDVVDDPEIDGVAGHQEERLADEELHHEVRAGRRFDLDRPRLVDRLPERLRGWNRILDSLRVGRNRAGDHALVGVDDGYFDHRAALDQPIDQLGRRLGVANPIDAQALQGTGNRGDVAQDFLLARAPHRLADRARRLV
jgi:hypothetical protein